MTISFDAIWIPGAITAIAALWALFWLRPSEAWDFPGLAFVLGIGLLLPAVPTLAAWAIYFAITP